MRKVITLLMLTFGILIHAQKDSIAYRGNRHLGIGFNYTSPAPGLSLKVPMSKSDLIQISYSSRSYAWNYYGFTDWGYNWTFYSAEYQHRMEEKSIAGKHWYVPFLYLGGGMGVTNWKGDYFWYFGGDWEKTQEWIGYNLGIGVEVFPSFFNNNIGITSKIGFGSYATANMYGGSSNGGHLMFGGSMFYYIK